MAPTNNSSSESSLYSEESKRQIQLLLAKIKTKLEERGELRGVADSSSTSRENDGDVSMDSLVEKAHKENAVEEETTKPAASASAMEVPRDPFTSYRSSAGNNEDDDDDSSDEEVDGDEENEEKTTKNRDLPLFPGYSSTSNETHASNFEFSSSATSSSTAADSASATTSEGSGAKRKYDWGSSSLSCNYNFSCGPMYHKEWTPDEKASLLAFANKWIPSVSTKKQKADSDSAPESSTCMG